MMMLKLVRVIGDVDDNEEVKENKSDDGLKLGLYYADLDNGDIFRDRTVKADVLLVYFVVL